uniref:Arrestin C-terminal-like domain-containing protein n=1 Tax=Xiphophorus couchianus TaxID=32473 RepID=A0A3B5MFC2_9TELE
MFQDTIKNFSISFDERNTFSAGDFITGTISFDLTKEIKISALTIKIKGGANVQWSTSFAWIFTAVNGTTKLAAGTHVYPFSCQLPEGNFPSSFRGIHGRISYSLTVSIDRPWHLSKDFRTELNFVSYIDPHQPELWVSETAPDTSPFPQENKCSLLCRCSLLMDLTAMLHDRQVMVKFLILINASSRTVTPNVKLEQKQIYYTHYRTNWTKVVKTLARFTGNPISAHTSDVQTEILLPIPLNAPQTISNCMILEVEYIIELKKTQLLYYYSVFRFLCLCWFYVFPLLNIIYVNLYLSIIWNTFIVSLICSPLLLHNDCYIIFFYHKPSSQCL